MAEIMEEKKELTPAETAAPASPETPAKKPEKSTADKKKRRRTIRRIVALVVVAALIAGGVKFFKKKDGSSEVGMATVSYGAISSEVDGSGLVKAKNSETISLTTAGTVMDVFVEEGQKVEQGDPLFTIDSPNAATEVQKARDEVEGYQKQINTLQKDIAGLNLSPSYAGKLMDVVTLNPGDEISKGTKVAVLADDTRMRLEQYYSYAYAGELKAGQKVQVSIPALMTTVEGTVEAVHMVSRITPEGSKLFSAEIVIPNEGVLAKDMVATATTIVNGDTVYPYEAAKLQYYRVGDLNSTVSGTVISSNLVDYLAVTPGQVLVRIDGEDSETEIFTAQQNLEEAQKKLEAAQKNLDNCNAVAPISGQVIGLSVTPGQELQANSTLVTISDTSTVIISATVDERNISYIKTGMSVNLDQWGERDVLGRVSGVAVRAVAAACGVRLPKVVKELPAQAVDTLAVAGHRLQALVVAPLYARGVLLRKLLRAAIFDEKACGLHVILGKEQDAVGVRAVASCAPCLLIVSLETFGHIIMDDEADVRLVNAHAEGVCRDHDGFAVELKIVLILPPLLVRQPRVVARGGDAALAQPLAHALDGGAGRAVDDAAPLPPLVDEGSEGGELVFRALYIEIKVRAVKTCHDAVGRLQREQAQDVCLHLRCCRGGVGRDDGTARQGIHKIGDAEIARAEILSPLRNAVRFVHGEKRHVHLLHEREKTVRLQPLGCNIDELVGALARAGVHGADLLAREGAINVGRGHAHTL